MSWLPTFLNWPAAAVAAAVAAPALLLLYFLKLKRREMKVSSTILWRKAIQDLQVNSPFQRLRRNLLLLLQMLILTALLLALSNPITFYNPGAGQNSVILLDRSASMNARDVNGGTRLDEAKRRATELVDGMGRGARAMVIAFDESAETVQPYTSDTQALKNAIAAVQPTDRLSKLKLAYQLADAQMNVNPDVVGQNNQPQQRVFLYSDGRVTDGGDLSMRGDLQFEPIGDPKSKNIGIVALSAKRNYEQPTQVQVFARLANFGPEPVTTDVQLSVAPLDPAAPAKDDFSVRQVKSDVKLLPARWTDVDRQAAEKNGIIGNDGVEFTLDLTTAATIKLEQMNKAADVLPADDTALVVIPPPKPLSVALVTDGGDVFLNKAVDSLNLHEPQTMTIADWERKKSSDFDVVMFDHVVPHFLPPAGNYVWLGAVPDGLQVKVAKTDKGLDTFMQNVEVLDWKRDHPMLRDLSLGKLFVAEALKLDVPLSAEVLIDGTTGPLVVLDREGRGAHLIVGFDVLQSNWPLRKSFPMFLYYALQYLSVGSDLSVHESFQPGATPKLPRANLDRALTPGAKAITLVTPLGRQSIPIPPTGDFALPPLQHVGLYRTDPVVPNYERLAVNLLDDNESNVLPVDKAPGDVGTVRLVAGGRSPLQLWWWILACGGIPLLMIEWWVYTRRVHS